MGGAHATGGSNSTVPITTVNGLTTLTQDNLDQIENAACAGWSAQAQYSTTVCSFAIPPATSGEVRIVDAATLNVIYQSNGSNALGDMKLVLPSDSTCAQGNG
jgi:hypothetical protein